MSTPMAKQPNHQPTLTLHQVDCMDYLAQQPDDAFDLAIVDPPYGIKGLKKIKSPTSRIRRYGQLHTVNDLKPGPDYFNLLFAKTRHQIIWGYNHLSDLLPSTTEFIFWHKHQPVPTYADGELAWTSFNKTAKCFSHQYSGALGADPVRIHPTQKPIRLYQWLLETYAKPGQRILDTHLGSGSSAIATHYYGCDFVGCELDPDYFAAAQARIEQETRQQALF
jgi:site-specific DNA-methyltransferase (adenine-specific)